MHTVVEGNVVNKHTIQSVIPSKSSKKLRALHSIGLGGDLLQQSPLWSNGTRRQTPYALYRWRPLNSPIF